MHGVWPWSDGGDIFLWSIFDKLSPNFSDWSIVRSRATQYLTQTDCECWGFGGGARCAQLVPLSCEMGPALDEAVPSLCPAQASLWWVSCAPAKKLIHMSGELQVWSKALWSKVRDSCWLLRVWIRLCMNCDHTGTMAGCAACSLLWGTECLNT